jgi:DNA-binding NarL/FixJ family response regulator
VLSAEQRALLGQLLGGATLGQAARALHLSRRTADRRLAAARAALEARTTAEALRRAAELGVDPAR